MILEVDGHDVRDRSEFDERASAAAIGSTLKLSVQRGTSRREIAVAARELTEEHVDEVGWRLVGLKVKDKSRTDAVAITSVRRGSPADRAGIRPGDLLVALNGVATDSVATWRRAISSLRGAGEAQLAIQRGPAQYRLTLPID